METNRLKPENKVKVEIFDTTGAEVGTYEGTGFHDISEAIAQATASALPAGADSRDYMYQVADLSTGTMARYRVNDHGHTRLLE